MNFYGKKVLFIGAHPDDIELGAGALIHHILPICDVTCVTLSDNQKNPLLKNVLSEHYKSMEVLGVPQENVIVKKFETRLMPEHRQEILEYFLKLRIAASPCLASTLSAPAMASFPAFSSKLQKKMLTKNSKP
jgi:LmbE family N-acetylglucosaminyl deacetylase